MLTKEEKAKIKEMYVKGVNVTQIAKELKVSRQTVYKIIKQRGNEESIKNKEDVTVADNVITMSLDESFKLVKEVEVFGCELSDTEDWLNSITSDDDNTNELLGLLKQVNFLESQLDEKNIDSAGLEKLYKLKNDVVVDGNRIIKVLNEKRKRKEEEELKRLEREKKEELERRKKEEEDSRQRSLERQTERYCSRPMGERQRMILRDGGVRDSVDQDFIIMGWFGIVREEKPENRLEQFKLFLNLSEIPRARYDYIAYWWERVYMK